MAVSLFSVLCKLPLVALVVTDFMLELVASLATVQCWLYLVVSVVTAICCTSGAICDCVTRAW